MPPPTLTALPDVDTATSGVPHAVLGDHSYAVYAQRIGYLENRLGATLGKLVQGDVDADSMMSFALANGHALLKVFIPKLMPLHEFRGYASVAAMEAGDYDEAADSSPDAPQIVAAFKLAMKVNSFDLFGSLGKLLDADLLRSALSAQMAARLTGGSSATESSTTTLATTSTPSGATSPTPTESAD